MRINVYRTNQNMPDFILVEYINSFDEVISCMTLDYNQAKSLATELLDKITGDSDKCECHHEDGECDLFQVAFRSGIYKKCMNHDCTSWFHGKLPACYHGDYNKGDIND